MSVLGELVAAAARDAQLRSTQTSLAALQARCDELPAATDVIAALRREPGEPVAVIAEVKRASPSKGALAHIADPAALAETYVSGGASMVSVLTEAHRFGGSLADFDAVRRRIGAPMLRKDFLTTPYQIWESRAHGADAVLLIVAALTDERLTDLLALTKRLGMQAVVEVHDRAELQRAVDAGATIVGVNARNLKTLELDPQHCAEVLTHVPATAVAVGESGVFTAQDVARYAAAGAQAVLVGEALVRSADPQHTLREFMAVNCVTPEPTGTNERL